MISDNINSIMKAIIGCAVALVGSLATAVSDSHITLAEWLIAASAGLTALGVVYAAPNARSKDHGSGNLTPDMLADRIRNETPKPE